MANDLKLEYLRQTYDGAFAALAGEVRQWIALQSREADRVAAEARVRAAEAVYRARRDALAAYLIRREVERRAYRLWEQSGRPHGTDVGDWTRAERQIPGSRRILSCVA
jgi:hypothetical protein